MSSTTQINTATISLKDYNDLRAIEESTKKGKSMTVYYHYGMNVNLYSDDEYIIKLSKENNKLEEQLEHSKKQLETVSKVLLNIPSFIRRFFN